MLDIHQISKVLFETVRGKPKWWPRQFGSRCNRNLYVSKGAHFLRLWSFPIPALQTLWGPGDYREEMNEMLAEQAAIEAAPPKSSLQLLRDRTVRWQLMSMSVIYFCNQLSGMSAVWMEKLCFMLIFHVRIMTPVKIKPTRLLCRSPPSRLTSS